MRSSSQVFIFINLKKALAAGIKFYLSSNGVVLTPGNEQGFLDTQFFARVEMVQVQKTVLLGEPDKFNPPISISEGGLETTTVASEEPAISASPRLESSLPPEVVTDH
jgi:RNA 2'-phosphotransferase, Tpt1 / KptA family